MSAKGEQDRRPTTSPLTECLDLPEEEDAVSGGQPEQVRIPAKSLVQPDVALKELGQSFLEQVSMV